MITRNAGIIGQAVDLSLEHLEDTRKSTVLFNLTQRLLYTKWRDAGEAPKLPRQELGLGLGSVPAGERLNLEPSKRIGLPLDGACGSAR